MKNLTLKSIRNAFKNQTGTVNYCINCVYVAADNCAELKAILPKTKKEAQAQATEIYNFGKCGEEKTINRVVKGCKTQITYTIKPSTDMVLRYFVAKYNKKNQ